MSPSPGAARPFPHFILLPDSHLEPRDFAVDDVGPLVTLASENELALDPWLDNYIEARFHGPP